jgi:arylsulfatase A-like enzyme
MPATEQRPNIVFIVLDTHRLDRLGCYGYPRGVSPNLDAFAQTATIFDSAISPAQWTIPVHASLFSGEPASIHMTVQSGDILDARFQTLAERLRASGYRTIGFCNNPLVGVINNGLRRGFETFYNYGGAIPSVPPRAARRVFAPFNKLWASYTQLLRRIAYPIQNAFANSSQIFQAALRPFWVPLWTRVANFKGDTARSIRDVAEFVGQQMEVGDTRPYFLFFNLMQTHLPFRPPESFVRTFAPRCLEDREARGFMRTFNKHAVRWVTPMEVPLSDLESQTLSDMYDAEVAYQDHLLAELFAVLNEPEHLANTMVILVSDHGEMLGEHQLMGHAFGVYQELIHVPLIIRFSGQTEGWRVTDPVSTTRLFHTVLEIAGVEEYQTFYSPAVDVRSQSLVREASNAGRSQRAVFSEAYAPEYALGIVESRAPNVIERSHCRSTHWAVYDGCYKLIRVEKVHDQLFALDVDPSEMFSLEPGAEDGWRRRLMAHLARFNEKVGARRPENWTRQKTNLDSEVVRQRLRDLGYLE